MHETNRIFPAVVLGIASIFMAASPSFGAPITYTEQAIASGTLNGVPFTDADCGSIDEQQYDQCH